MGMRRRFAFTLIEILVCLSIVVVLLAVTAGVYSQAVRGGKLTGEIEQMHQLSLAASLYREQHDSWPVDTRELVNLGLATPAICHSARDPYQDGFSNAYLKARGRQYAGYFTAVTAYPNTYLSLGDIWLNRPEEMNRLLAEQDNPGLFVSLIDSGSRFGNDSPAGPFTGRYRRALLDGSVVIRRHQLYRSRDAKNNVIRVSSDTTFFFDPSERWVRDFMLTYERP